MRSASASASSKYWRGEQDGRSLGSDSAHHIPELAAVPWVEAGRRLVEEQQIGHDNEARGEVEPATHTPRERRDRATGGIGEIERLQ
jgi:hypothetical protein